MPVQTVQNFFNTVRATHARGTSLDALLPSALHNALQYIESNYNLSYMRNLWTFQVSSGASRYTWVTENASSLKTMRALYYYDNAGTKKDLRQVPISEITSNTGDMPTGFFIIPKPQADGSIRQEINFDCAWPEAQTLYAFAYNYYGWNKNELDSGVVLINTAEQLVLARMMMQLAPVMRDPQLVQLWGALFQDNINVLLQAQDEFERGAGGYE
ncbi:MAG: hypothetical protein C0436_05515 [Alphaproteobacteria bacterium]|nr:hypothetical protein [Alphaproteobacteria bacterium]